MQTPLPEDSGPGRPTRKRPVPGPLDSADLPVGSDLPATPGVSTEPSQRGSKKLCSPPASVAQQRGSSPPTPGRSRARLSESISDFDRGLASKHPAGRQLWSPDDDVRPKTPQTRPSQLAAASGAKTVATNEKPSPTPTEPWSVISAL